MEGGELDFAFLCVLDFALDFWRENLFCFCVFVCICVLRFYAQCGTKSSVYLRVLCASNLLI